MRAMKNVRSAKAELEPKHYDSAMAYFDKAQHYMNKARELYAANFEYAIDCIDEILRLFKQSYDEITDAYQNNESYQYVFIFMNDLEKAYRNWIRN